MLKELTVFLVSALPIAELRGGLPLGLYYGFSPLKSFLLGLFGNLIIILPLLLFWDLIINFLEKFKFFQKIFNWLFRRTLKKRNLIDKYGPLGLMIFAAIPLPYTGAYSATLLAHLLGLEIKKSLIFISLGVLIAGLIVLLISGIIF